MARGHTIAGGVIEALRLWPIWIRLGARDVRLRFQRTSIGIAWIFFQLFITIFAVGIVYGKLLGQDLGTFLPSLTIGLVVWNHLTSSIVIGGNAFIASEGYIKQIGLPIYVYIFRFFISLSITFLISFLAFIAIALVYRVKFGIGVLWAAPGLFILELISLLLTSIFAYLNTRFRDAAQLTSIGMQVLFYVTPVLWPADLLRDRAQSLAWIVDFNPMYHVMEVVREPLLHSVPASFDNYLFVALFLIFLLIGAGFVTKRYHRLIVFYL